MGKIKTEGHVTLEFDPDLYEITINVRAEGKTSGAAVTAGKKQTETLLQSLQDNLQIKPEQISAERENVDKPSRYDEQEENYHFSRTLCLKIPADNRLREAVTDLLADMDAVTYMITERLSDENKQKKAALDAAIKYAKQKAEQMADTLGSKVIGFEEIFTDGTNSRRNAADMYDNLSDTFSVCAKRSYAADLQKPKIKISGEVTVVWLTEPLT